MTGRKNRPVAGRIARAAALGFCLAASCALGQDAAPGGADPQWPTFGGNYANTRYTPLAAINAGTVGRLTPAWIFQTGKTGTFESSPVVVGSTLYLTTPYDTVYALDARTGQHLWTHNTSLGFTAFCCGPENRGVAVAEGKVFYATLDGHLIALDAKTGNEVWNVQVGEPKEGFSETMAPLAWNGMVFVGSAGGEYGIRGSFTAYSAADGKQLWRWWSVGPGWEGNYVESVHGLSLHRDIAQEKADAEKYKDSWQHGGGPIWTTPALDPATGTIFLSTGNPAEQIEGEHRPGDNLYTDSIVALDGRTGTMKWAYQQTPHDVWDYDAASPPLLFAARDEKGRMVPAVGEAGKTGWFYVLDRADGHLLRVSQSFVPQPNIYPKRVADSNYEPGALGGSNWSAVSYNPGTHLVYIASYIGASGNNPGVHTEWKPGGDRWNGGAKMLHGTVAPPSGNITALDPSTGKIAWQVASPKPVMGGSLTTPDLTFIGEQTGMFNAFDARTGKRLWQFQTGAGIGAPPVAYRIGGREYIAIASGGASFGGSDTGGALVVFALPAK